jgi:hypothetical protein
VIERAEWVRLYRDVPRVFAMRVGDTVIEGSLLPRAVRLRVTGADTGSYEVLLATRKVIAQMLRHVDIEYWRAGRGIRESLGIRERVLWRWDDEVKREMARR